MTPALRPWGLLAGLALLAGCYSYSEPAPPRNVQPVGDRARDMAASGIDMANAGPGREQRSGMTGTTSDVDDDEAKQLQLGMPELAYAEGLGGPGYGNTRPQADLDAPDETRNAQARGIVFRPSDHYFVNGVDTGPSVDAMPGTGGPAKLRAMKRSEARELRAAELMAPAGGAPAKAHPKK
ncbi:MAG TPA: hypothetical protein VEJ89_03280 [Myxococcaceae bacterium]|jgi:hypothetical protein|nr:hypothetical protein [Myxococcaceae bacterium]